MPFCLLWYECFEAGILASSMQCSAKYVLYAEKIPSEYEYKYYSVWENHRNTNTNNIRFQKVIRIRIWIQVLASVGMFCSLEMPWSCLGNVWGVSEGYLIGIHRNWRRSDVFGGYVGSQSLQYWTKTLFRCSPERQNFCHLTILRHWNIKMVAYKLSKNGWVMLFLWFSGFSDNNHFSQLPCITLYD